MDEIRLEPVVWTARFETERAAVEAASPDPPLGVFHVGSTAVPDLLAKPVLDVLAVYAGYEPARAAAAALVEEGYTLRQDDPDWLQVTEPDDHDYPVFLHLRPRDVDAWRDQLVFVEYLRENRVARREYERVKRAAAAAHPDDPEAYTDAKAAVVRTLLGRAYEAGYGDSIPEPGGR